MVLAKDEVGRKLLTTNLCIVTLTPRDIEKSEDKYAT